MNTFIAMLYWYIRCNPIGGIDMNTNIEKHINQVCPKATPTLCKYVFSMGLKVILSTYTQALNQYPYKVYTYCILSKNHP